MKFGKWKIIFSWEFGFGRGIFPMKDYIIFDWWLIGFIKIMKYRDRGERVVQPD